MNIELIWNTYLSVTNLSGTKLVSTFDFCNVLNKLGYKYLTDNVETNTEGIVTKRIYLALSPDNTLDTIILDGDFKFLAIISTVIDHDKSSQLCSK